MLCAALAVSCGGRGGPGADAPRGNPVAFKYARLVRVWRDGERATVSVADPWHAGRALRAYALVPRGSAGPAEDCGDVAVTVPLRRSVVAVSPHCALLAALGKLGAVAGVCDGRYMLSPQVRRHIQSGAAKDFGPAMSPDRERLVAAKPDAMLLSPLAGGHGTMEKAGIPIMECADYMEESPLARAEWMRVYGMLYGCGRQADSLFAAVEKRYLALKAIAAKAKTRPRLMCDLMQSGTWYVPGGASTLGQAFADAGADYIFGGGGEKGGVPLTAEAVAAKATDADVWIVRGGTLRGDLTYASLRKEREIYSRFRPWRRRRIFACNTLRVPFFDETPFRPDLLLRDLVMILHPELGLQGRPRYFRPISE